MKQLILFTVLLGSAACQSGVDVTPIALPVAGVYRTNGFLDYRFLTLAISQMPVVTLTATKPDSLTLTISRSMPGAGVETLTGLALVQQPDKSYEIRQAGQVIGSLQTGRAFTNSGMETQGRVLRLSTTTLTFTGYQP